MSTTIDQKVLEMRFDNKQFEENVTESISTLDKLKGALNFDKLSGAFGSISSAAGKVDFSPISSGVETVIVKFNALEMAAVQAISNIITNGINKLQTAVNELTFEQIGQGWSKYEEKTQSVQTIMAATGKDIEEVNAQLQRLNWFSDETSYSFTDMTSNVGKFTSVGVELETAVTAMQGISTWAALAGANVPEASRAMYNLSQAMGVGAVKLMDWKSIENAGMATSEFKETVLDTAAAMGTLRKYADGTYQTLEGTTVSVKNFNSTLADGWFSSEVLLESLDIYGGFANELAKTTEEYGGLTSNWVAAIDEFGNGTDALNDLMEETGMTAEELYPILQKLAGEEYELGRKAFKAAQEAKTFSDALDATKDAVSTQWMNTFEYLFGNYEEAKDFFTEMTEIFYELFGVSGEVRNEILEQWSEEGFGDIFRTGVLDVLWSVSNVVNFLKGTFQDIFPEATKENAVKKLEELTTAFGNVAEKVEHFTAKFKLSESVISRLRSVFDGFGAVLNIVKQAFSALSPAFTWLKDTAVSLADIILSLSAHFGEWLVKLSDSIRMHDTFGKAVAKVGEIISPVTNKITELINKLKEKLNTEGFNVFDNTLGSIGSKLEPIWDFLDKIYTKVKQFFTDINFSDTLGSVWGFVKNIADTIWDLVKGIDLSGIGSSILEVLRNVGSGIKNIFSHFNIGQFLTDLGTGIQNLLNSLGKGDFSNLFEILTKGTMLYGGFNLGSLFGSGSDALKNLGGGEGGFFARLISPVTDVFDQLKETIGSFTKDVDSGKITSIAVAVGILSASLIGLSMINEEKIDTALIGLAGALGGLTAEMKYLSGLSMDKTQAKAMKSTGLAMIEIAGAVAIMVLALKPLAEMDLGGLAKGLAGMSVIMTAMFLFISKFSEVSRANLTGKFGIFGKFEKVSNGFDKQLIKAAEAMILLGAAMKIFASAMKDIGSLDIASWGKGLGGITIVLAEMLGFTAVVSKLDTSGVMKTALAMIALGAAMKIFASAIADMGEIDFLDALQGIGMMSLIMGEMLIFIGLSSIVESSAGHIAGIAASMIILGLAMKTFASAMNDFAKLDPTQWINAVAQMTIVFAGMLIFIGIASVVAEQAGQIAIISASMILLGLAMQAFAKAATDFAGAKWGDLGKIAAVLVGFVGILTAIGFLAAPLAMATSVLLGLGVALMAVGGGLTLIGIGLTALNFGSLIGHTSELIRHLEEASVFLNDIAAQITAKLTLENFLTFIKLLPEIVFGVINGIIAGILSGLGEIMSAFGDMISGFTEMVLAFLESFKEIAPSLVETFLVIIVEVLASLAEHLPEMLVSIGELVVKLIAGLVEYTPQIVSGLVDLLCVVFDSLTEHIPRLLQSFMAFVGALFGEILKALDAASPDAVLKMIEFVGFLSLLVIACAALKAIIPGAMLGLVELGLFTAELSVILAALGALNSIPGFESLIGKGGNLLQAIGTALGQFVGGIIGGIAQGATASLPTIGTHLSKFMENLSPFIEGVGSVDSNVVDTIKNLAEAILILTAANILDGLMSFFTGKDAFEEFGKKLADFGPYFKQFAESVKGVDAGAMEASSDAIVKIADTFNKDVFKSGGLKQFITGSLGDLKKFGEGIVDFAPYLKQYTDQVNGFDGSGIDPSLEAIKKITKAFNEDVFKTGGLKQLIGGQTDLAEFAKGLNDMAPSLVNYSQQVKNVDQSVLSKSITIAETLTQMSEKLNPDKSFWKKVFGGNEMTEFSENLKSFGGGLETYYGMVSIIDTGKMDAVTGSLTNLLDAVSSKDISSKAGADFSKAMRDLAEGGVNDFLKAIEDKYTNAKENGAKLLNNVIDGIKSKVEDLKSEMTKALDETLKIIKNIQNKFKDEGANLVKNLKDGASGEKSSFTSAFTDLLTDALTAIEGKFRLFYEAGSDIVSEIVSGVESGSNDMTNAMRDILEGMLDAVDDNLDSFSSKGTSAVNSFISGFENVSSWTVQNKMIEIGSDIVDGVVKGINDNAWKVQNAIDSLAQSTTDTMEDDLGINSPSKVFFELGSYTGEGFVNGLSSWIGKAESESERMSSTVIAAVSEALADTIQNDIETDPVIRPVLDLSDVEAGSKKLNTLMSTNTALKAGSSVYVPSASPVSNSINNSRNFGGFTFNIYPEGGNAKEIAKEIGAEVNRRIRQFSTI